MSGTWSGFSEDDIQKLKSGKQPIQVDKSRRVVVKAKRRTDQNNAKSISVQLIKSEQTYPMPEEAKLSLKEEKLPSEMPQQPVAVVNETSDNQNAEIKCENNSTNSEKKVVDLVEFQAKQKLIEEQNRQRKIFLSKALADRTMRTKEEARRLKEIQNEYKKIDSFLSNDIAILRHQIEIASLDFMEAQKHYHKVEKDFLEAKIKLHQKLEKKEMLTEHLCTIIEKNEERKAEKLNELMNRLITEYEYYSQTNFKMDMIDKIFPSDKTEIEQKCDTPIEESSK